MEDAYYTAKDKRFRSSPDWEELTIANDFIFGKVMQDKELCLELLKRILSDLEIIDIEYPEPQKTIREDIDARSVRLDVYVKSNDGMLVYDIEMQTGNYVSLPKRTRYYTSQMDLELLDRGRDYENLPNMFVIFIMQRDIFGQGRHIYTFRNICVEDRETELNDMTTKIFLTTAGTMDDVSPELRRLLDYVGGKPSEDDYTRKLDDAVKAAKRKREWRREYMFMSLKYHDVVYDAKHEGLEEGRAEGLEEGIMASAAMMRSFGHTEEEILQGIMTHFNLTREQAESYLCQEQTC